MRTCLNEASLQLVTPAANWPFVASQVEHFLVQLCRYVYVCSLLAILFPLAYIPMGNDSCLNRLSRAGYQRRRVFSDKGVPTPIPRSGGGQVIYLQIANVVRTLGFDAQTGVR
jgi:hypothetical protein